MIKVHMIGIYKITNPKGKVYIGQSINLKERFRKYNKLNCKRQVKLYNSLKKYGPEKHKFEIIEECLEENLNEREDFWGEKFQVLKEGLNLKLGSSRGRLSEETKLKISNSLLGKKKSKEHCLNLSKAKTGIPSKRKGKPDLKQRGKKKPGAGGKGKPKSGAGPKTGNGILNANINKKYKSIKECMDKEKISKRRMFLLLKDPNSSYKYLNRNYWKSKLN